MLLLLRSDYEEREVWSQYFQSYDEMTELSYNYSNYLYHQQQQQDLLNNNHSKPTFSALPRSFIIFSPDENSNGSAERNSTEEKILLKPVKEKKIAEKSRPGRSGQHKTKPQKMVRIVKCGICDLTRNKSGLVHKEGVGR